MHALSFDSPALDAAHTGGLTTDQRGLPRPIDDPNIANAEGDPNLRLTRMEKRGGDISLSFNSMLGKTCRVAAADELPAAAWNVLTNKVPGTGGGFQALDGGAASLPQRYYRAVMLAP